MANFVVTALGVIAVGSAAFLGVRLRDSRVPCRPFDGEAGLRAWMAEAARTTSAALAGGVLAGFLVAGFGGRLLMRVVAMTSNEAAQGRLTEADEVVGRVTGGGTAFLVTFVGLFSGIIGALSMLLFRRLLPDRSWAAGLTVAGVIGGVLARPSDLLNPDSIDFEILGPGWFAAAFGVALIAGLGIVGAELIDTFTNHWPTPTRSFKGLTGLLPLLLLGALGPGLLVAVPVLALRSVVRPDRFLGTHSAAANVLAAALIVAGVVGWLWIFVAVGEIVLG